jgi:uncharacterized protein YcbK (DUF882 family)
MDCLLVMKELDRRLASPADYYTPSEIAAGELGRVERVFARAAARSERSWREGQAYQQDSEVHQAYRSGELELAIDRPHVGFSSNMTFKYVTSEMNQAMDLIAQELVQRMASKNLPTDKTKLVITSTIRSVESQRRLIEEGKPAAVDSSHTYGIAFDISYEGFERHDPEAMKILEEILQELHQQGKINLIHERLQKVWHIALSPDFQAELDSQD